VAGDADSKSAKAKAFYLLLLKNVDNEERLKVVAARRVTVIPRRAFNGCGAWTSRARQSSIASSIRRRTSEHLKIIVKQTV
jgi:hypothetical protein